jgi:hypothetical protein
MGKENKERQPKPERLTLEYVAQMTKEHTLKEGQSKPTVIIEGSQNRLMISIEMEDTFEGRSQQLFDVGWTAAQVGAIGTLEQVFLIAEGWISKLPEIKNEPFIRPSEHPNRAEVLIVSQYDLNSNTVAMNIQEILRDAEDNLIELKPFHIPEKEGATTKSPLLTAFLQGYITGLMQPPQA